MAVCVGVLTTGHSRWSRRSHTHKTQFDQEFQPIGGLLKQFQAVCADLMLGYLNGISHSLFIACYHS